jgi:hypothetical protein
MYPEVSQQIELFVDPVGMSFASNYLLKTVTVHGSTMSATHSALGSALRLRTSPTLSTVSPDDNKDKALISPLVCGQV